jgi:shikimate dehydrogenase
MAEVRRAAVLGSPITHSLSPALHRAAYRSLGLAWSYDAFDVTQEQLPDFLQGLDDGWAGLSLTMPLKECVIDLLVDVDDAARLIRSVNTVLPAPGGWRGTNTDVYGITQALRHAGLAGNAQTAVILGAGATARSAVAAVAQLGVSSLTVCARRAEAAEAVARLAAEFGLTCAHAGLEPDATLLRADVVISTLPGDAGSEWAPMADAARGALLDAAYHPWPSPLAAGWGGSVVASGRDMLLWQAVEQVRLMTGLEPSADEMRAALPA